jgi:hypothetical protein
MMELALSASGIVLAAIGTFLILPHRLGHTSPRRVVLAGAAIAWVAVFLLAGTLFPAVGSFPAVFQLLFTLTALGCAGAMISSRGPGPLGPLVRRGRPVDGGALPAGRGAVPGGGDRDRLRRGDHRDVSSS